MTLSPIIKDEINKLIWSRRPDEKKTRRRWRRRVEFTRIFGLRPSSGGGVRRGGGGGKGRRGRRDHHKARWRGADSDIGPAPPSFVVVSPSPSALTPLTPPPEDGLRPKIRVNSTLLSHLFSCLLLVWTSTSGQFIYFILYNRAKVTYASIEAFAITAKSVLL